MRNIQKYIMIISVCITAAFTACVSHNDEKQEERIARLHEKILTIDTHVDINPADFTENRHLGMPLNNQVDLLKMKQGGLDAVFFIVYVSQGQLTEEGYKTAKKKAQLKFDAIHRMTDTLNSDLISFAHTPEQLISIDRNGLKSAMIGVENAYPLGTDIDNLNDYFKQGARYISLVHNGHNQFADSNYPKYNDPVIRHNGLSPLGENLIKRANELGMMIDVSHASKKTTMDTLKLSKAPIIASHSAIAALHTHTRNVDDDVLHALKKNKGVIHVVAFKSYLKPTPKDKLSAINALAKTYKLPEGSFWEQGDTVFAAIRALKPTEKASYFQAFRQIVKDHDHADVKDLVDHIDYVVKKVGIDHVGISSDFGGGGGITGWQDASETLSVTRELVKRGYSDTDIEKIWGGNLIRVWKEVRAHADTTG